MADFLFDEGKNKIEGLNKTAINEALQSKADAQAVANAFESVNEALNGKANANEVYTKEQTYNRTEIDNKISELPEPMIFKGTLGDNGTISVLPVASAANEGWTYKCITAGTYSSLSLKVGDTVTCYNSSGSIYEWIISGYADTDTDTWRSIKINGVEKLGNGISSGAVDFVNGDNINIDYDADGNKVVINSDLSSVNKSILDITGNAKLQIDYGYYYDLSGSTVGTKTKGGDNNSCCSADCVEGDSFTITGGGQNVTRVWAFADINGNILSKADANTVLNNAVIVAPANAVKFFSNNTNGMTPTANYSVYGGVLIKTLIENGIYIYEQADIINDYYYDLSGNTVSVITLGSAVNACCSISCVEGEKIVVTAGGGNMTRAWAFVDANGNILSKADANKAYQNLTLKVPQNAVRFYSNNLVTYLPLANYKILKQVLLKTKVEKIDNETNKTNFGIQLFEKIGVISDSISVGWAKDKNGNNSRRNTGISWVQQLARRIGCTAYNLGASGVDPIEWFQPDYEFAQYCYIQYQSVGFCDLYIIGLGLNGGNIGTIADINENDYTQNASTFYGQYARIIQMINAEHPNAKVICLTEPTIRISEYDTAVRNICALNFINAELLDLENNYFDLFNTPEILAELQPDGLHYTPYGYSLIAEAMMLSINDYISKNSSKFKFVGVQTI